MASAAAVPTPNQGKNRPGEGPRVASHPAMVPSTGARAQTASQGPPATQVRTAKASNGQRKGPGAATSSRINSMVWISQMMAQAAVGTSWRLAPQNQNEEARMRAAASSTKGYWMEMGA